MIKKLLFGVFLGLITTLFFAQYDPSVHKYAEQVFAQAMKGTKPCSVTCKVKSLNFFLPRVEFEDVTIKANNDDWFWQCKQYVTEFSWIHFLIYGVINLWVSINDLNSQSIVQNNELAIIPHLQELIEVANLPLKSEIKSLMINKGTFNLKDPEVKAGLQWHCELKRINNKIRSSVYLKNCFVDGFNHSGFNEGEGNISLSQTADNSFIIRVDCKAMIPQLDNEGICFIGGTWQHNHGRFSIRNISQTFSIDPIVISERNNQLYLQTSASIPGSYLYRLFNVPVKNEGGSCFIRMAGTLDNPSILDGYIALEDIHLPIDKVINGKITFNRRLQQWDGTANIRLPYQMDLSGGWNWDEIKKIGTLSLSNNALISLPYFSLWKVDPQEFTLNATVDSTREVKASYSCLTRNKLINEQFQSKGTVHLKNNVILVQGNIVNNSYEFETDLSNFPYLFHFNCFDEKGLPLITTKKADTNFFETRIDISFLRHCLTVIGYDLQGEGLLTANTVVKKDSIESTIHLANGTIRLPQTYNFLDGLDAQLVYKVPESKFIVENMAGTLHSGNVSVSRAVIEYKEKEGFSAYIPLRFNHCMLNLKQDLFAMVSGRLLFEKRPNEQPLLKGSIILDRAQLKENIFSDELQKKLLHCTENIFNQSSINILCDLKVQTKDPIRIDTEFLQTSAKLNVSITDNILIPKIEGTISLLSGTIHFPYKSLMITKGSISFVPDQPYDPLIELVAKNKIKKHQVTLHVTGSLHNHYIALESSPPLSDEQVVALLLVGSHEESLNMMMPALIAQNVRNIIFSSNQSNSWDQYYKQWVKPFNINLIPSFTDQTGRGGLRGSLEIDINERWRALIQKNFNLTEDTRFELEYFISDDVSLRAIRDERKDIATEVEMRWKF